MHSIIPQFNKSVICILIFLMAILTCNMCFGENTVTEPLPSPTVSIIEESHYECNFEGTSPTCEKKPGKGINQCKPGGFKACHILGCVGRSCTYKPGIGKDECINNYSCEKSICKEGKCVPVGRDEMPAGASECLSDYQCSYKTCARGADNLLSCVKINGPRPKDHVDCSDTTMLGNSCYHYECKNGNCEQAEGQGANQCAPFTKPYCYHYETKSNQCVKIPTPGIDSCDPNLKHGVCEKGQCVLKPGPGKNECSEAGSKNECSHKECVNMVCKEFPTKGKNQCSSDKGCFHLACKNHTCQKVAGKGENQCSKEGRRDVCSHRICKDLKCVTVKGAGESNCDGNRDCANSYCQNGSCKLKAGNGNSRECDPENETRDCWHKECDSGICSSKPTPGQSTCDDTTTCPPPKEPYFKHTECQDLQCVTIPGWGMDRCGEDDGCYYMSCGGPRNNDCRKNAGPWWPSTCYVEGSMDSCEIFGIASSRKNEAASNLKSDEAISKRIAKFNNIGKTLAKIKKQDLTYFGYPDSPIKIEIFSDITCGMCNIAFNEIFPKLYEEYASKRKAWIIFREYPLLLTKKAVSFSEAALCAGEQNKYDQYVHWLYHLGKKAKSAHLNVYASDLGLDAKAFEDCIKSDRNLFKIDRDVKIGEKRKIDGTPTFFINKIRIEGAQDIQKFRDVIDSELKKIQ